MSGALLGPAALATVSSALWGTADFGAGLLARRHRVAVVIACSQGAGLSVILAVHLLAAAPWSGRGVLAGAAAGVVGGAAVACFYRALAVGPMSLVATVSGSGVLVPLAAGVATGEHPTLRAWIGMGAALAGLVLVTRAGRAAAPDVSRAPGNDARDPEVGAASGGRGTAVAASARTRPARPPWLLSGAAAVGFGLVLLLVRSGARHGDALTTLTVQRAVLAVAAAGAALLGRPRGGAGPVRSGPQRGPGAGPPIARRALPFVAVGALDLGANACYAVASRHGGAAVIGVLASLYPAATVVLAWRLLGERLSRVQAAGVGATLLGVALLAG